MIILGIETSCDETGAAVLEQKNGRIQILSNVVASSAPLQSKYGGIIPEQAAREQIKSIIPVIQETINDSRLMINDIGAIAVTYGPGLIGSLLVGVETAKTLAAVWNKPLIGVNHLIGHFYANWIQSTSHLGGGVENLLRSHLPGELVPKFPCVGLLISGGHTDLVLFTGHGKYKYLGGTRDDAAGECFDKCARLLGLPYPGGPEISRLAEKGKDTLKLPRPMIDSGDFDFSFSGLKTAVANLLKISVILNPPKAGEGSLANARLKQVERSFANTQDDKKADLCTSIEAAIVDVLVTKTIAAAQKYNIEQIMIAGGVAANQKLIKDLRLKIKELGLPIKLRTPPPKLCTDNAAMIAAAAFYMKSTKTLELQANPNLSLAY